MQLKSENKLYLLQLGDLEGSMGLAGLHLKIVDLHVSLLDLVLHVELLAEDGAGLVVELLAEDGEVILAHGGDVRQGSNLFQHSFRNTHLGVLSRTEGSFDLSEPARTRPASLVLLLSRLKLSTIVTCRGRSGPWRAPAVSHVTRRSVRTLTTFKAHLRSRSVIYNNNNIMIPSVQYTPVTSVSV